tara:strand:+ start:87 stop:275 length:189 start_codon:yes stop_codon:yes gene_type:complete
MKKLLIGVFVIWLGFNYLYKQVNGEPLYLRHQSDWVGDRYRHEVNSAQKKLVFSSELNSERD